MVELESLRAQILERPWRSLAAAFAAGVVLAIVDDKDRRSSILGAAAISVLRDMARSRTRSWIDAQHRPHAQA